MVFILSDSRWVRTAFRSQYEEFDKLGDDARDLGADFLQKLFDHTVIVPQLTRLQKDSFTGDLTGRKESGPQRDLGRREWRVSDVRARIAGGRRAAFLPQAEIDWGSITDLDFAELSRLAQGDVSTWESHQIEHAIRTGYLSPAQQRELRYLLERNRDRVRMDYLVHTLSMDVGVMPANPRMIRRVANTWGMLTALTSSVQVPSEHETLARAAIFFVRFPTLVEHLLSAWAPPDETSSMTTSNSSDDPWKRWDVVEVLTRRDGTTITLRELASCFGCSFPEKPIIEELGLKAHPPV